jgi:WD40 repeat protein
LLDRSGNPAAAGPAIAFDPRGRTLAIAAGSVQLWDTESHRVAATLTGSGESPQVVAYSPDGKTLAVGNGNGSIYFWSTATHRITGKIRCPVKNWGDLEFSPNGKMLAAVAEEGFSGSGKIYLYKVVY